MEPQFDHLNMSSFPFSDLEIRRFQQNESNMTPEESLKAIGATDAEIPSIIGRVSVHETLREASFNADIVFEAAPEKLDLKNVPELILDADEVKLRLFHLL